MDTGSLLPPFPNGWYTVALSRSLPPGVLRSMKFMGQEVVLFRTRSGAVSLMDAYCPHLGAHMGHGGRVNGESLRCPFHGFEFDTQGHCTFIPYGTRPPPKAQARVLPVQEVNGFILAYYDCDGRTPDWQIPALEMSGWSPLNVHTWTFRGHPQETSENSVDFGHLSIVHHYNDVHSLAPLVTDGPHLFAQYSMTRAASFMGRDARTEFDVHVHGLGYSQVDIHVLGFELHARLFVLATPVDQDHLTLRVAIALRDDISLAHIHPFLAAVPRSFVNPFIANSILAGVVHDVEQDIPIWQYKRYVQPPILAEGDGPVGKYRLWARQFYRGADVTRI